MLVKTDQPIMPHRDQVTQKIAHFWDQMSEGWQAIWGQHIHHGYYQGAKLLSPQEAQEQLIEKLAELAAIRSQSSVLDAGCGMGGSSIYLAKKLQAHVTGITLSEKQVAIATQQAQRENVENVTFKVEDALSLTSFADNSFDVVWSLESCEQFFDKKLFFQQAYRVLKPGGKLLLATWCSQREEYMDGLAKDYQKICLAFDLPYMPTMEHYRKLFSTEHFVLDMSADWTHFVSRSWDIGVSLLKNYSLWQLLKIGGWRGLRFAKQIKLMQKAFHQNRIKYGVFLGTCTK